MPYFSVIIPVYNREKRIAKSIESVLAQVFSDFELLVIDDASTDGTEEIVKKFTDKRIRYVKNDKNIERCLSRNKGIQLAKGKYICFLDSDDYHLPEHLKSLYHLIQEKGEPEAFFFSNAINEWENGTKEERICPNFDAYNSFLYLLRYTVNPQRWAVHKKVFEQHLFDPKVVIAEDMDTSLRILSAGTPFYQLRKVTTVYVQAADSFSHADSNKWEKELFYFKRIFSKNELKGKLPKKECKRLLSMCYFHLSLKAQVLGEIGKMYKYGFKSYILYPKGYNGKTNKILLVNAIYGIPILGFLIKKVIQSRK